MLQIRAQVPSLAPTRVRQPKARDKQSEPVHASISNARDLSNQVHTWYVAARGHLAEAHHCDRQIVRLQGRMDTLDRTLGRASPILVGCGAPLLGFGEVIHAGVVSHGAMGLLMAGLAGALAWVGSSMGIKRRIAELTDRCSHAHDRMQNYTRLAEAMDPERTSPRATVVQVLAAGLQKPRAYK